MVWPFRKKRIVVRTYSDTSPWGVSKKVEKDARRMLRSGYHVAAVVPSELGIFGITTTYVQSVTYALERRGRTWA